MSRVLVTLLGVLVLCHLASGALPNGHAYGCEPGNVSHALPFCDPSLATADRIKAHLLIPHIVQSH